jgi:hypothetical protein
MIATHKAAIAAMMFAIGYAVVYVICTELNLPLLTYHPVIGEIDFLWAPERRGPVMYWYGWMLTSFIAAAAIAAIASITPEAWLQRTITFGALAAIGYLVLYTLALFVYDRATIEIELLKSRWLSAITATVIAGIIALILPARWNERVWPGWVCAVPVAALVILAYYLSPYFTR